jgi:hypothetical protein
MRIVAIAVGLLLGAGAAQAMGPNPGGKLGEDMPFQGDDVVRRAPAATAEREPRTPAPPCPAASSQPGSAASQPERKDCIPAQPESPAAAPQAGPSR